jgi:hypothetical protein
MMDDVGRSSVKSAASAVAPVAVPVALLLLLLFCPAALFRCHSVLLQCHQQLDEQEEPAKPASQQEEKKKRQSVIERFGLVWFGFVLFCFAFPHFLVLISGILLPTARRSATGTFLFHVPLLLFLFYCCWLQCYNIVVGLVRELFFFSFSCEHYNSVTERSAVIEELPPPPPPLQTGLLKLEVIRNRDLVLFAPGSDFGGKSYFCWLFLFLFFGSEES